MALKDCKFFVNVNGKKTEMDYDQFRAYLLEDANLNAVAPDLTRKKGAKAGYEVTAAAPTVTAKTEAAPVKAAAAPARAEAAPATTTVETVTAEPSEAKRIADSVGKQKVDAQGFTPAQREYLVDKVKEVYKEVQKDSAPDKFVIKVPGDGQFTVKTSVEVNSLHRRLTGNDVPGVTPQDKGASDMERVKKGITFGNKDVNAIRPFSATSKPAASEMFKEDEGNALYPLERHGTAAAIENKSTDKEYVTDGSLLIPSSAIEQGKTKLIKAAPVKTEGVSTAKVQFVWQKATKEATVPAEIAGVWQSSTAKGLALIEVSGRFIALDPNKLNLAIQLTGADGVLIPKNADSDSLVVLTRQGQPVAVIAPFRLKPENVEATFEGAQDAINEMKGEGASPTSLSANLKKPASKVKAEAAPAPAKLSPATPRPITVESLRETMNLTKAQAEAVLAVYEAMGLPLPTMRVAKGVFDKPELQEQYEKSMAEEGMLARGYIEFFDPDEAAKLDGVLAVIRGFGAANFSTPVHEGAHFYRRFMLNEENGFTAQEIKAAEDWAGAKNGKWSVAAEEKWARGFERYLRSGQAPIPALNKLFEKIARWMRKVYETVTGSAIDVEVSPEVKRVFDRIFEIQAARQKGATGTIAGGKRDTLSQADERETDKAAMKWAGVSEITPVVPSDAVTFSEKWLEAFNSGKVEELDKERQKLGAKLRKQLYSNTNPDDVLQAVPWAFMFDYIDQSTPEGRKTVANSILEMVENYMVTGPHQVRPAQYAALGISEEEAYRYHDLEYMFSEQVSMIFGMNDTALHLLGLDGLPDTLTPPDTFTTGKPVLVKVHHGTGAKGVEGGAFSSKYSGSLTGSPSAAKGYFFAGTPMTSSVYASTAGAPATQIYKFYVKLENPLVYDMEGAEYRSETYSDLMSQAKDEGRDGLIITNTFDGGPIDTIVAVLHGYENQIKSADAVTYDPKGNPIPLSKRFDPATTSIFYQDGRPVTAPVDSALVQRKMKERARILKQEEPAVGPVWRSNIASALKTWNQDKGTPQQLMAHLGKVDGAQEEAKWIGLNEFLEGKKSVTKAEVADFVDSNPYVIDEITLDEKSAPSIHLGYRLLGGEQYREIVFTSPKIQQFTAHHYTNTTQSYLTHMRLSTFRTAQNQKTILVDEAQSDLHQKARKAGYSTPQQIEEYDKQIKQYQGKSEEYSDQIKTAEALEEQWLSYIVNAIDDPTVKEPDIRDAIVRALHSKTFPPKSPSMWHLTASDKMDILASYRQKGATFKVREVEAAIAKNKLQDDFNRLLQTHRRLQSLRQAQAKHQSSSPSRDIYPVAPFQKSAEWTIMLFKRAIRLAVEEGADFVAWTPGEMQSARYKEQAGDLKTFYDTVLPKALQKFIKQWGGKIEQVNLDVAEASEAETYSGVTDELLLEMREELQYAELEGNADAIETLRENIAEAEAELNAAIMGVDKRTRTFPAIRITPQMKAEAMKGFTLFQAEESKPGKVSAEAVKQKQAERARILKQEEPTEPASRINEYIAQIDAFKKEISQKTGEPFSLLTLAPRDLDAYERLIDQAERVASYEAQQADIKAREADIKPRRALVDKAAMDWAGVSEVTPAAPPSEILGTPSDRFKTGQPVLVKVYHGTGPEGIQGGVFSFRFGGENTGAESARQGYFFAGTEETAGVYTMSFTSEDEDEEQGDVYEFYVRLDNPFVFNMGGGDYSEETYFYVMQQARADGHDGAIIINTYDGGPLDNIFTVLHGYENQIKSADLETYGPDGKPVPLSERFNPKTTSIYFQDDKPVTAPVDSAFVQRKMKERAERLRQAKAGQAATGEAKPKAEAKATPPPPPQAAKTARPSGTTRPSAPRQGKSKTDEQRLKDAKERAANPPAEPSEETMVNRKVQAFINTFAKSLFAGSVPLTMTDAAGNQVDTESVFLDMLKQYRAAFAAADQGRVDAVSAKLREITRPPRAPKDLKQLMEEAKKRAGQPKTAKTAAQKREQDIGKEVQKAINNFARLRSTGKISEMVDLGDGVTVSREDLLLQALADLQAAYRTSNTYLGAPEIAKAQRRIMDILFVPPRVPKKPYTAENILTAHAWGTASVRSPLSYLNMVGSYEAIAGELGARVSEIFQFTRTQMAHGYYPSWGAAITDLQRSLKGVKEELRQAGYPGMLPVIDAHVDRIRKSAEGVGALTPENVKKAWDNGNIGGLASNVAKAFVFNTSLRFSPKAVLMNYMQPLFTLFPHVTPKEFYNFWVDSGRPETVARVRDLALKESGGRIEGMGTESKFFNPFTKASERARIMGHLAGEMMADRLNLKGLARDVYVRGWTEKVEFDNSAWNVPPAFSGNLNSVLFQFKPYVAKNVERFVADWKRGVEGSSSGTLARRAKLIGVQLGVGGIGSLLTIMPGVKGITGILILGYLAQAFSAATGDDEFGEKIAETVFYGAPAWIGLDLASSTGFLEEPFGDDAFQQALNLVAGPAIYKSAAAINGLRKYYEDAQKVAPLGKEKEKEEVLARRRRTVLNSITPLSRMAETAWSLAQGKRPDMFLEEPTPLQNKEVILRLLGGSPIRQTKFYDYKESFDWQKSLLNRPIDIPGIKRLKKETDATYKERVKRIEGWREQYRNELTSHPRFSRLSPEDQEKAFELLQRNITEQANQVRPNEALLKPARILRSVMTSKVESKARARKRLYTEPED